MLNSFQIFVRKKRKKNARIAFAGGIFETNFLFEFGNLGKLYTTQSASRGSLLFPECDSMQNAASFTSNFEVSKCQWRV